MNLNYNYINLLREAQPKYTINQIGGTPPYNDILAELFQILLNPPTSLSKKDIEEDFTRKFRKIKLILENKGKYKIFLPKIKDYYPEAKIDSLQKNLIDIIDNISTKIISKNYTPIEQIFINIMNARKNGRSTVIKTTLLDPSTPAASSAAAATPAASAASSAAAATPAAAAAQAAASSVETQEQPISTKEKFKRFIIDNITNSTFLDFKLPPNLDSELVKIYNNIRTKFTNYTKINRLSDEEQELYLLLLDHLSKLEQKEKEGKQDSINKESKIQYLSLTSNYKLRKTFYEFFINLPEDVSDENIIQKLSDSEIDEFIKKQLIEIFTKYKNKKTFNKEKPAEPPKKFSQLENDINEIIINKKTSVNLSLDYELKLEAIEKSFEKSFEKSSYGQQYTLNDIKQKLRDPNYNRSISEFLRKIEKSELLNYLDIHILKTIRDIFNIIFPMDSINIEPKILAEISSKINKITHSLTPKELICKELIDSIFWTPSSGNNFDKYEEEFQPTANDLRFKIPGSIFYPIDETMSSGSEKYSSSVESVYNAKIKFKLSNTGNVNLVITPNSDKINYKIIGLYRVGDAQPQIELSIFRKGEEHIEQGYKSYYYFDKTRIRSLWYGYKRDSKTNELIDTSVTPSKIEEYNIENNGYLLIKELISLSLLEKPMDIHYDSHIDIIKSYLLDVKNQSELVRRTDNYRKERIAQIYDILDILFKDEESKEKHNQDLIKKMEQTNKYKGTKYTISDIETLDTYVGPKSILPEPFTKTNHPIINLQAYRFATYYSKLAEQFDFMINHKGIKERQNNRIFYAKYLEEIYLKTPFLTSDIYLHQFTNSKSSPKYGHNRYQLREQREIESMFEFVELAKSIMFTFVSTVENIFKLDTMDDLNISIRLNKIYSELSWCIVNYKSKEHLQELFIRSKTYRLLRSFKSNDKTQTSNFSNIVIFPVLTDSSTELDPFYCEEAGHIDVNIKEIINRVQTTAGFTYSGSDKKKSGKLLDDINQEALKEACKDIVSKRPVDIDTTNFKLGGLEGLIFRGDNRLNSNTIKDFYENFYGMSETDHYIVKQKPGSEREFIGKLQQRGLLLLTSNEFPELILTPKELIDRGLLIQKFKKIIEFIKLRELQDFYSEIRNISDIQEHETFLRGYKQKIEDCNYILRRFKIKPSGLEGTLEIYNTLQLVYKEKEDLYKKKKSEYIETIEKEASKHKEELEIYYKSIFERSQKTVEENIELTTFIQNSEATIRSELENIQNDIKFQFVDIISSLKKSINDTQEITDLKINLTKLYNTILMEIKRTIDFDTNINKIDSFETFNQIQLHFILDLLEKEREKLNKELSYKKTGLKVLTEKKRPTDNIKAIIDILEANIEKCDRKIINCKSKITGDIDKDTIKLIRDTYTEIDNKYKYIELNNEITKDDYKEKQIFLKIENLRILIGLGVITIDITEYEKTVESLIGTIEPLLKTISQVTKETKSKISYDGITQKVAEFVSGFNEEINKQLETFIGRAKLTSSTLDHSLINQFRNFLTTLKTNIYEQYDLTINGLVKQRERRLLLIANINRAMNKQISARKKRLYKTHLYSIKRQLHLEKAQIDKFNKLLLQTRNINLFVNKTLQKVLSAERKLMNTSKQLLTDREVKSLQSLLDKYLTQQEKTFNVKAAQAILNKTDIQNEGIDNRYRQSAILYKEKMDKLLKLDESFVNSFRRIKDILKNDGKPIYFQSEDISYILNDTTLRGIPDEILPTNNKRPNMSIFINDELKDISRNVLEKLEKERRERTIINRQILSIYSTTLTLTPTPYIESLQLTPEEQNDSIVIKTVQVLDSLEKLYETFGNNVENFIRLFNLYTKAFEETETETDTEITSVQLSDDINKYLIDIINNIIQIKNIKATLRLTTLKRIEDFKKSSATKYENILTRQFMSFLIDKWSNILQNKKIEELDQIDVVSKHKIINKKIEVLTILDQNLFKKLTGELRLELPNFDNSIDVCIQRLHLIISNDRKAERNALRDATIAEEERVLAETVLRENRGSVEGDVVVRQLERVRKDKRGNLSEYDIWFYKMFIDGDEDVEFYFDPDMYELELLDSASKAYNFIWRMEDEENKKSRLSGNETPAELQARKERERISRQYSAALNAEERRLKQQLITQGNAALKQKRADALLKHAADIYSLTPDERAKVRARIQAQVDQLSPKKKAEWLAAQSTRSIDWANARAQAISTIDALTPSQQEDLRALAQARERVRERALTSATHSSTHNDLFRIKYLKYKTKYIKLQKYLIGRN
jgi:hypothetical protein